MTDPAPWLALVLACGIILRQRRSLAALRLQLSNSERCHEEAAEMLVELTAECDAYRAEEAIRERRRGLLRVVR